MDCDIAVIGIGCRLPGESNSPKEFWENILNKRDMVEDVPEERWSKSFHEQGMMSNNRAGLIDMKHWKNFDPLFFGVSPKESMNIDPQQRLLYTVLWEAFEDAHITPSQYKGTDTSVFIGSMNRDYTMLKDPNSNWGVLGTSSTFLSNGLSFAFDLRGPSMSIDSACSSSLNAIYLGCQSIISGQSQMSVCGGVNALFDPAITIGFTTLGILGKCGISRPFDADADGYVRSEGVGLVILKKLSKAIIDKDQIYCVIKATNSNEDGRNMKNYPTQPSGQAQFENIDYTMKKFQINPSDIFYFEAHGTSTAAGDPIEIEAVSRVFKDHHSKENPLYIGSLKSNLGHSEAASGVSGLIKVAMMMKHRKLVSNINFNKPNPKIDFEGWNLQVVTDTIDFPQDKTISVGINCFGFGGSNCFMVIQEYNQKTDQQPLLTSNSFDLKDQFEFLIPFSTNSQKSFDQYIDEVIKRSPNTYESFLDFIRYQSQSKDLNLQKKFTISCKDWDDLKSKRLSNNSASLQTTDIPSIAFVFCGQGPQWNEMLDYLHQSNSTFRNSVELCDNMLKQYFGYSIIDRLKSIPKDSNEIHHPIIAQPSLFLFQFGIIEFLKSWGIQPDAVIGHSFGEVASALCSGIINLETAIKIVYFRSTLQQQTIGSGRMISIGIGLNKFNEIVNESTQLQLMKDKIEISCFNSPDSIVLTSSEENLKSIQTYLREQGIFSAFLGTPCSFHSSKQDLIQDKVIESLSDLYPSQLPIIPFFSTVTGKQMENESFYNNHYIFQNLRNPVRFEESIQSLHQYLLDKQSQQQSSTTIYIEISPHPTLSMYIPQCLNTSAINNTTNNKIITLSIMNKKKLISEQIQQCLSQLFLNGVQLNFQNSQHLENDNSIEFKRRTDWIPKYQWDTQEYWNHPKIVRREMIPSSNLLGINKQQGNMVIETLIDLKKPAFQFLKGHIIKGQYIFPGSGYVDILLKQYPNQDLTIYNLKFEQPLVISNDIPVIVQTVIQQTMTLHEFRVDFYFRNINNEKWTKSSHGRFGLHSLDYNLSQFDIDKLKQECSLTKLNKTEVYKKLSQLGLPYGPSFQKVNSTNVGPSSVLSSLDVTNIDKSFELNAVTIDTSNHGYIALLEPPQELVLDSFQTLIYYPSNITLDQPGTLLVYSKTIEFVGNKSKYTIDIINPVNGRSIIHIDSTITSITRIKHKTTKGNMNIKHPSKEIFTYHWQPKESIVFNHLDECSMESNQIYLIKSLVFNNNEKPDLKLNTIVEMIESHLKEKLNILYDFTIIDLNPNQVESKQQFENYSNNMRIRHRTIQHGIESFDPNKEFIPISNYDIIVISSTLLDSKTQQYSILQQLHNILIPKGSLMIIDNYSQDKLEDPKDSSLHSQLTEIGFTKLNLHIYQKESISHSKNNIELNNIIIIPSTISIPLNQSLKNSIETIFENQNYQILNCNDFLNLENFPNNGLIFFYGIGSEINKDNYIQISMDFIKVSKNLHKLKSQSKLILLTEHSNEKDTNNKSYLNGSLIGCYRYLKKEEFCDIYSINIDQQTLKSLNCNLIANLLDQNIVGLDREFKIRNGTVLVQRLHQDQLKSNSYESDINNLYLHCNPNLELTWYPKLKELPNKHYEIKVMASGINFKDNMFYRGLLPQDMYPRDCDIYNPAFGLECSGIVTRIGPGCTKFKIGDRVLCIAVNSIGSHVFEPESNLALLPDNIGFTDSAPLVTTYLTSYFSLFSLVRIKEFGSILIHTASGGVGLSTLNILKWKNYKGKIFVSVGSAEKEKYLRDNYGDMITDYFNSRTHSYSSKIKEKYGSVDIILNTLSGDFMSSNFNCLSKVGRIIDLSVTQLIENETMDLGQLKYSKAFISFEILIYNGCMPGQCARKMELFLDNISKGNLKLVPLKVFQSNQVKEAIETIGQSKHVGKFVINFENVEEEVITPMIEQYKVNPTLSPLSNHKILKDQYQLTTIQETLLITGQAGIVIPILKWILQRSPNIKNIIILSKSTMKWEIELMMNSNKQIQFIFKQCDVSDKNEIKRNIELIQKQYDDISIKSVIHLATVYDYTDLHDMNELKFSETHKPKAIGAINLHELSIELNWNLDNFILFSSIAAFSGSDKQCHYISANLLMDHLADFRKSIGLSATSINFGGMEGGGVVANNKSIEEYLQSEGINTITLPKILGGLDIAFQSGKQIPSNFQLSSNDFLKIYCKNESLKPKIEHLITKPDQIYEFYNNIYITNNIKASDIVLEQLVQIISKLLSIELSNFNSDVKLKDYGFDSLMTTQLKNSIEDTFENTKNLFTYIQLISNSTNSIATKISNALNK
ncbi:putative fatty acid synthase [Tieghemostelium lacteum]|uniref:Putative fatty acid synthase n=1 Tax=Tieghemostelium lacteum TaxID=361077 RepID=A0A152A858_TIELA|nr:putative fatty acid synthase [Tieghemostelium lacteum]|eukprot:KYR02384.1 putative fatty acid synthase [Tieghemostelium lacteum]